MLWDAHILIPVGIAAVLVGFSKSGLPGLGILVVPLMAHAFPARDSVGVLLPMLIVGDVLAIARYRRDAQWRKLLGLLPYVVLGMIPAAIALVLLDNESMRPVLGCLILALLVLEGLRARFGWTNLPHHPLFVGGIGAFAGIATTIGNAGGPVMHLYFLSRGFEKRAFVGTAAWFFFVVNCSKVPLYLHLGMITDQTVFLNLSMVPLIAAGAWLGSRLLPVIPQQAFNMIVLALAGLAAMGLLL